MGLFGKQSSDEPLDPAYVSVVVEDTKSVRRKILLAQGTIRQALREAERVVCIASHWNGVALITDQRLLELDKQRLRRSTPLNEVSGVSLGPWGTVVRVTAKPEVALTFDTYSPANTFAIALDPRDVPRLWPQFFEQILADTGHPTTEVNMSRLVARVARMIMAGGAYTYFEQTRDMAARRSFDERFKECQSSEVSPDTCDEMVDWLWQWGVNCHGAIRELIKNIRALLVGEESPLWCDSDEIPGMEW